MVGFESMIAQFLAVATLCLPNGETVRTDCFRGPEDKMPTHVAWAEVTRTDTALKVWIGRRIAKGEKIRARGTANPPESMFAGGAEVVELAIAPCADGSAPYYHFIVNPSNVVYQTRRHDTTWKPSAPVLTRPVFEEDRWGVELTIPYAALDVAPPKDGDAWRVNFTLLSDKWTGLSNYIHDPQEYGTLVFGAAPRKAVVESAKLGDDGCLHLAFAVPVGPQEGEIPHKVGGEACDFALTDGERRLSAFGCRLADTPASDFVLDRFYYPAGERLTMTYAVKRLGTSTVRIRRLADDAVVGTYPDVKADGSLEVGPLAAGDYAFEIADGRFSAARQFGVCDANAAAGDVAAVRHYPVVGSESLPSAYLSFGRALPCRFTRKEATGYVFNRAKPICGAEELLKDAPADGKLYRLAYEAQMAVMFGDAKSVEEHVADRAGFYADAYRRLKERFPLLRFSIHVDHPEKAEKFARACDVFEYAAPRCSYAHNMLADMKGAVDKTLVLAGGKPVVLWLGAAFPDNGKWRTADELNTAIRYCILRGIVGNVFHLGHGGVPESNTRLWSFMRGCEKEINGWYPAWADGTEAPIDATPEAGVEYGFRKTLKGGILLAVNLNAHSRSLRFRDPASGQDRVLRLPGCGSALVVL